MASMADTATMETSTLLNLMIRALVDRPEAVRVDVVEGGQSVIYEVTVEQEDVRRVIGRRGRTAGALRELMLNLGSKAGRRYVLEIVEPERALGHAPTHTPSNVTVIRRGAAEVAR